MEDEHIVDLYLARNEKAIAETQLKYGSRLRSLSHCIVEDILTAEECENDTYLQAWESIPPHQPRTYLFAFLACIARHLSLNCCRARRRLKRQAFLCQLTAEMEECIPAPDDTECRLEANEFRSMLNSFLLSLAEQKRYVFLRRYWYLDSISRIAALTGMSESAVKTQLFRTRNQLRNYLEEEGYHL